MNDWSLETFLKILDFLPGFLFFFFGFLTPFLTAFGKYTTPFNENYDD
jgi:hypothetical protein